ncbi:MAG: bifunctional glutamate N-acetyltransferase/amino-acid acetyltransferase ArgJ [Planctomycetota bacterium]
MTPKESVKDTLFLPSGFRFAGVACGIKPSGKKDLALIVAEDPCVAAGVYTQNQIVAAPVVLCRQRTPSAKIRGVITNSGNANACTGEQGEKDAEEMCQRLAEQIECRPEEILVMSTGIIGHTLPMDEIREGITVATRSLSDSSDAFYDSADGICTTDKFRKTASAECVINGHTYRVAAMAKGAGMIAPNMATMLAVVLTDAPLTPESAQHILSSAAQCSFNRVSVDGHTSTNDTMLLLSSGKGEPLTDSAIDELQQTINRVSVEVAKMLVADGEGASHFMQIHVSGASSDDDAETIGRTIGASPLVKTAITGGDPNWGRIVSAAGYAGVAIDPARVSLSILDTPIYSNGSPVAFDEAALSQKMKQHEEVTIQITVGTLNGQATIWASDLTTEYVRFNSEYTT